MEKSRLNSGNNSILKDKMIKMPGPTREKSLSGKALKLDTIGMVALGMVHDFNNLMTTISGYAEILSEELPIDSTLSEKVIRLRSAVTRASELLHKLTSIGDLYPAEKSYVNLNQILQETINLFNDLNSQKISVQIDIPAEPVYIVADPNQLFRIFLNLFINAFQSMHNKGGLLSVSAALIPTEKSKYPVGGKEFTPFTAVITVKDNGPGIERNARKQIFDAQYSGRSDSPINGLGLSVVHDIVKELKGNIRVSSKSGSGTTFRIYLPSFQKSNTFLEK